MGTADDTILTSRAVTEVRRLTAQIIAAHVSHNNVAPADLPALIGNVYTALQDLGRSAEPKLPRPIPAVPIKKSVTPDWIFCLENGRRLRMLKRHLRTAYGMSPDQYRERWGLASDYPMVAPNYAQQRSTMARSIGLGTRRNAPNEQPIAVSASIKGSRSRRAS
jgi:predicted transcriptional regulator